MPYSHFKFEIQALRLIQTQEREEQASCKQRQLQDLLSQCNHRYDDGTSARVIWEQSRTLWG